jgi:zinc D-Ala-D-Ala dipeptidase
MNPPRKISVAEPVTALRHIPIRENGEEMVDFMKTCPHLLLDVPRFNYRRETVGRKSLVEMLCLAAQRLPNGFRLAIVEIWRPPHIQARMYRGIWQRFKEKHPEWSDTKLRRYVNRYTAPLDRRVPPPHTTGGAVDLLLVDDQGQPLDHCSPFEVYDPACYAFDAPGLSEQARRHRQILQEALTPTGITNYPSEYWHWSYGDQGWAYRGGHPAALYGQVQPADYTPAPEDLVDEPLRLLDLSSDRRASR